MRALFPSTDGTLLPVTDTESNFNVFPNESVVFKSADLAARQELDKIVRTTATRQPHVRFIKNKRIFKSHTSAKVRNNLDNPKLWGIRSAERIFFRKFEDNRCYIMNDFEEYIRQGEPHKREKGYAWQTAIGLQAVDDLKPSEYLIQTARQHIEGDITIEEAKQLIDSYYQSKTVRADIEDRTEEADKVSAHIAEILSEKTFTFSPVEYITIHRRLFQGIYKFAGKIRDYNITKKEWVLNGETVLYASADSIRDTLDYDFGQEKNFSYKGLNINEAISHIAKFISGVWQIHAFGEGNTRTTAVFTIKYLRTFGFDISNEAFFRNLILHEHNELKNRTMLVQESSLQDTQSANTSDNATPKCNICTLNCTLEEMAVLNCLREQPKATQKEIASHIGKSERTILKTNDLNS